MINLGLLFFLWLLVYNSNFFWFSIWHRSSYLVLIDNIILLFWFGWCFNDYLLLRFKYYLLCRRTLFFPLGFYLLGNRFLLFDTFFFLWVLFWLMRLFFTFNTFINFDNDLLRTWWRHQLFNSLFFKWEFCVILMAIHFYVILFLIVDPFA